MGRNEEGRRRREQFVKEPKISFLLRRNSGLSVSEKPLCTAYPPSDTVRGRSAVSLQPTILHISNMHVVCGPAGPSRHANIILSLSLIFSPLSLSIPLATQLQLAYFNSAGKKEGRKRGWGLKPGHAVQHLCRRMLRGTRHNNAKRCVCVAWLGQEDCARRSGEQEKKESPNCCQFSPRK